MTDIKRYDMEQKTVCGEAWQDLEQADEMTIAGGGGEWCRYGDAKAEIDDLDARLAATLLTLSAEIDARKAVRDALADVVDILRRSMPEYVESHVGVEQCTEEEWDEALAAAEEALEPTE